MRTKRILKTPKTNSHIVLLPDLGSDIHRPHPKTDKWSVRREGWPSWLISPPTPLVKIRSQSPVPPESLRPFFPKWNLTSRNENPSRRRSTTGKTDNLTTLSRDRRESRGVGETPVVVSGERNLTPMSEVGPLFTGSTDNESTIIITDYKLLWIVTVYDKIYERYVIMNVPSMTILGVKHLFLNLRVSSSVNVTSSLKVSSTKLIS